MPEIDAERAAAAVRHRFMEIAAREGVQAYWVENTTTLLIQLIGDAHDRETLDQWRERAREEVWRQFSRGLLAVAAG